MDDDVSLPSNALENLTNANAESLAAATPRAADQPAPWRCRWGFHSWVKRPATLNADRIVCRCRRCPAVRVKLLREPGETVPDRAVLPFRPGRRDAVTESEGPSVVIYDRRLLGPHHGDRLAGSPSR